MTEFLYHMWPGTTVLPAAPPQSVIPTRSLYHRFHGDIGDQKFAVRGIHGCTALVVASRAGFYVAHYYEEPSFDAGFSRSLIGRLRQDFTFWKQVQRSLRRDIVDVDGVLIPALLPFVEGTGQARRGEPEFKGPGDIVKVLIVTPR